MYDNVNSIIIIYLFYKQQAESQYLDYADELPAAILFSHCERTFYR